MHLSGCAKGCARRAAADLTLIGGDGRYGVVIRGNARDQPVARMEVGELIHRLKLLVDESSSTTVSAKRLARALAEA